LMLGGHHHLVKDEEHGLNACQQILRIGHSMELDAGNLRGQEGWSDNVQAPAATRDTALECFITRRAHWIITLLQCWACPAFETDGASASLCQSGAKLLSNETTWVSRWIRGWMVVPKNVSGILVSAAQQSTKQSCAYHTHNHKLWWAP
jgi:hypothetical protein